MLRLALAVLPPPLGGRRAVAPFGPLPEVAQLHVGDEVCVLAEPALRGRHLLPVLCNFCDLGLLLRGGCHFDPLHEGHLLLLPCTRFCLRFIFHLDRHIFSLGTLSLVLLGEEAAHGRLSLHLL